MTMGSPAVLPSSPRKNHTPSAVRRTNKPLVEKKRRARINGCLGQLKSLLLSAMKTEGTQVSRLEKADILEMTVKYLRHIQCQPQMVSPASSTTFLPTGVPSSSPSLSSSTTKTTSTNTAEPDVATKFSAGYTECASEVIRYMASVTGMTDDIKTRLESHLVGRLHGSAAPTSPSSSSSSSSPSSSPLSASSSSSTLLSPSQNSNSNTSRFASKPLEKPRTSNPVTNDYNDSTINTDIVSPRHYQTALDLANMASNIVQQQQQQQQYQKSHNPQHHHQYPAGNQFQRQPEEAAASVPVTYSNMATTPDTPPNTPPHMQMDTDCYKTITTNNNNNEIQQQRVENNTPYNFPSSSLSLSSPSFSSDDDEMIIADNDEDYHTVPADNFKRENKTYFHGKDIQSTQHVNINTMPHANTNYIENPPHTESNQPINTQIKGSPINLIRRRLPLSAYATPLHIEIPETPSPSITPSPPHILNSRPGPNTIRPNPEKSSIRNPHHYSHNSNDNESLPTILYGACSEIAFPRPSAVSVTHGAPHPPKNTTHLSGPETVIKTPPQNTCNLDNYSNNAKCHTQAFPLSSSPSSYSSSSSSENLTKPPTHRNPKQTLQTVPHSQGHQIDNTGHAPSPSLPTLNRQEDDRTCTRPNPAIRHPPPPHPCRITTQKLRHSPVDSHYHNSPTNGHAHSSTPHVAKEIRESPAIRTIVFDDKNAVDMRMSNWCDRKSATTNNDCCDSNPSNNNFRNTTNNAGVFSVRSHQIPAQGFKHQSLQNLRYQEQYHHQQLMRKQQQLQQQQFANLKLLQYNTNRNDHAGNNNNTDIRNNTNINATKFPFQQANTRPGISHDNTQYRRNPYCLNDPLLSRHPQLNNNQQQNEQSNCSSVHPNYTQNHPQYIGMRSEGELLSTRTHSTATNGHFVNENPTISTDRVEQCPNYNSKTRAIVSIAEAETAATRQNRTALLPSALRSGDTGQVSEVNSYSTTSVSTTRPAVARPEVGPHESQSLYQRNGYYTKGHNAVNYTGRSGTLFVAPLDVNDCNREQVWRPW